MQLKVMLNWWRHCDYRPRFVRKNVETHSKIVRAGRSVGVESKVDNSRVKEEMAFCTTVYPCICSLHGRRNLTLVSNICEAAPMSLFWAHYGLNKLPEMHFIFAFNLIGKSTVAFLTGRSWCIPTSWYTAGSPKQGFQHSLQTDFITRV